MSRMTPFSSPLLLGFDAMEKTLERISKSGDGYPPYNIERLPGGPDKPDRMRITPQKLFSLITVEAICSVAAKRAPAA